MAAGKQASSKNIGIKGLVAFIDEHKSSNLSILALRDKLPKKTKDLDQSSFFKETEIDPSSDKGKELSLVLDILHRLSVTKNPDLTKAKVIDANFIKIPKEELDFINYGRYFLAKMKELMETEDNAEKSSLIFLYGLAGLSCLVIDNIKTYSDKKANDKNYKKKLELSTELCIFLSGQFDKNSKIVIIIGVKLFQHFANIVALQYYKDKASSKKNLLATFLKERDKISNNELNIVDRICLILSAAEVGINLYASASAENKKGNARPEFQSKDTSKDNLPASFREILPSKLFRNIFETNVQGAFVRYNLNNDLDQYGFPLTDYKLKFITANIVMCRMLFPAITNYIGEEKKFEVDEFIKFFFSRKDSLYFQLTQLIDAALKICPVAQTYYGEGETFEQGFKKIAGVKKDIKIETQILPAISKSFADLITEIERLEKIRGTSEKDILNIKLKLLEIQKHLFEEVFYRNIHDRTEIIDEEIKKLEALEKQTQEVLNSISLLRVKSGHIKDSRNQGKTGLDDMLPGLNMELRTIVTTINTLNISIAEIKTREDQERKDIEDKRLLAEQELKEKAEEKVRENSTKTAAADQIYNQLMDECNLDEAAEAAKAADAEARAKLTAAIENERRNKNHQEKLAKAAAQESAEQQQKAEQDNSATELVNARVDLEANREIFLNNIVNLPKKNKFFLKEETIKGWSNSLEVTRKIFVFNDDGRNEFFKEFTDNILKLSLELEPKDKIIFELQCYHNLAIAFLNDLENLYRKEKMSYISPLSSAAKIFTDIERFFSEIEISKVKISAENLDDTTNALVESFTSVVASGRERLKTLEDNILNKVIEYYKAESEEAERRIKAKIAKIERDGPTQYNKQQGPSINTVLRNKLRDSILESARKVGRHVELPKVTHNSTLKILKNPFGFVVGAAESSFQSRDLAPPPAFNSDNFPQLVNANSSNNSNTGNNKNTREEGEGGVTVNEDASSELYCEIGIQHFIDESKYSCSAEYLGKKILIDFYYNSLADKVTFKSNNGEDITLTIEELFKGDLSSDGNNISSTVDISRKIALHQLININAAIGCFAVGTDAYNESKSSRRFDSRDPNLRLIYPNQELPEGAVHIGYDTNNNRIYRTTDNVLVVELPAEQITNQQNQSAADIKQHIVLYNGHIIPEGSGCHVYITHFPNENRYMLSTEDFGELQTVNIYYNTTYDKLKFKTKDQSFDISIADIFREGLDKSSLYMFILAHTNSVKRHHDFFTDNYRSVNNMYNPLYAKVGADNQIMEQQQQQTQQQQQKVTNHNFGPHVPPPAATKSYGPFSKDDQVEQVDKNYKNDKYQLEINYNGESKSLNIKWLDVDDQVKELGNIKFTDANYIIKELQEYSQLFCKFRADTEILTQLKNKLIVLEIPNLDLENLGEIDEVFEKELFKNILDSLVQKLAFRNQTSSEQVVSTSVSGFATGSELLAALQADSIKTNPTQSQPESAVTEKSSDQPKMKLKEAKAIVHSYISSSEKDQWRSVRNGQVFYTPPPGYLEAIEVVKAHKAAAGKG